MSLQFEDNIYWTDWQQKAVMRAEKLNGKNPTIIRSGLENAMGVTIVTAERQKGWNPCAVDNGGCSHLCFFTKTNYTCGCPDNTPGCQTGNITILPVYVIKLYLY